MAGKVVRARFTLSDDEKRLQMENKLLKFANKHDADLEIIRYCDEPKGDIPQTGQDRIRQILRGKHSGCLH